MTATRGQKDKKDQKHASSGEPGSSPTRRRHWVRWTLAAAATTVLLVLLAVALAIRFRPVPAPLVLPAHTAGQPAGPLAGSWHTAAGSMAGFRVPQTVIGLTSNAVGRTDAVSGAAVIAGDRVVRATFRVDLTTINAAPVQQ